jgi:hypothetical protein
VVGQDGGGANEVGGSPAEELRGQRNRGGPAVPLLRRVADGGLVGRGSRQVGGGEKGFKKFSGPGCWDEAKIRRMMDAGDVGIKERISMTSMAYSILKKEIKEVWMWSKVMENFRMEAHLRILLFFYPNIRTLLLNHAYLALLWISNALNYQNFWKYAWPNKIITLLNA